MTPERIKELAEMSQHWDQEDTVDVDDCREAHVDAFTHGELRFLLATAARAQEADEELLTELAGDIERLGLLQSIGAKPKTQEECEWVWADRKQSYKTACGKLGFVPGRFCSMCGGKVILRGDGRT